MTSFAHCSSACWLSVTFCAAARSREGDTRTDGNFIAAAAVVVVAAAAAAVIEDVAIASEAVRLPPSPPSRVLLLLLLLLLLLPLLLLLLLLLLFMAPPRPSAPPPSPGPSAPWTMPRCTFPTPSHRPVAGVADALPHAALTALLRITSTTFTPLGDAWAITVRMTNVKRPTACDFASPAAAP